MISPFANIFMIFHPVPQGACVNTCLCKLHIASFLLRMLLTFFSIIQVTAEYIQKCWTQVRFHWNPIQIYSHFDNYSLSSNQFSLTFRFFKVKIASLWEVQEDYLGMIKLFLLTCNSYSGWKLYLLFGQQRVLSFLGTFCNVLGHQQNNNFITVLMIRCTWNCRLKNSNYKSLSVAFLFYLFSCFGSGAGCPGTL